MKSIDPNLSSLDTPSSASLIIKPGDAASVVFTVWRKSLIFNCRGFTVFDTFGNLAYRVDSYSSRRGGEIVLMDAAGKPLLTSRRKKLSFSLGQQWLVYGGEEAVNPHFVVKKHGSLYQSKTLAYLTPCNPLFKQCTYEIEGSYIQRFCVVYGEGLQRKAEIKPKEAAESGADFGSDVFRLVVYPGIDTTVAMVIVVLLDQMFVFE